MRLAWITGLVELAIVSGFTLYAVTLGSLTSLCSNPFWSLIDNEIDALVTADLGKRP